MNKLTFNKYNEERAKNIPEHTIYFVKVLIDNIIYLFEKERNIDNNLYLHVVIGYLLKIVLSKFNFIPSHKLVIILYQYLCNSLKKLIKRMNINDEFEKVNKDFCFIYHLFEDEIINENNKSNNINEKQDFETNLEEFNKFYDTEKCLQNPCFKFFIKYDDMNKLKQYFFILILNYLKVVDNDEKINYYILLYYLNKNYFNEIEIVHIDKIIKNIERMDEIVVENKNALNILKYSLKILNTKETEDIKKITNELISFESTKPKVTDCFDDTNKYYEDLLNELLYKIKKLEKIPKINSRTEIKNYWCSIIELLSILIQPKDLENNIVKIIFYFIIKLIDVDLDFLVTREFLSNNLYTLLDVIFKEKSEFLLYPEIPYLINNNQDIYNFFLCDKNEEYFYSIIENDIENMNLKIFQQDDIYKNMKKYKFRNIFISMTSEYVAEKYLREISASIIQYNKFKSIKNKKDSLNIFYNVYLYYHRIYSKEYHLVDLDLKIKDFNSTKTYIYMNKILNEPKFLELLESIMNSQVMEEAYKEINKLDKDYIEQIKDNKDNKDNKNKYDKYDIYTEYFKFIQNLKKIIKGNIFILMQLSSQFKGITCRFLKIIINSQDIIFNKSENTEDDNIKLISAYLIFIIIHEFNHFIKRYYKIGYDKDDANTPREDEGGKEIINLLFGHHLLNRNINIAQAIYILNINNWNMKNIKAFREEYSKISTVNDDKSISFLFSGEEDICYYGFIKPDNYCKFQKLYPTNYRL